MKRNIYIYIYIHRDRGGGGGGMEETFRLRGGEKEVESPCVK